MHYGWNNILSGTPSYVLPDGRRVGATTTSRARDRDTAWTPSGSHEEWSVHVADLCSASTAASASILYALTPILHAVCMTGPIQPLHVPYEGRLCAAAAISVWAKPPESTALFVAQSATPVRFAPGQRIPGFGVISMGDEPNAKALSLGGRPYFLRSSRIPALGVQDRLARGAFAYYGTAAARMCEAVAAMDWLGLHTAYTRTLTDLEAQYGKGANTESLALLSLTAQVALRARVIPWSRKWVDEVLSAAAQWWAQTSSQELYSSRVVKYIRKNALHIPELDALSYKGGCPVMWRMSNGAREWLFTKQGLSEVAGVPDATEVAKALRESGILVGAKKGSKESAHLARQLRISGLPGRQFRFYAVRLNE